MRSKFRLNDLVVITAPIDIEPCDTTIEKGEQGKVVDIDPDNGDLVIRVKGYRPNLFCRNNCVSLSASEASRKIKRLKPRVALDFVHLGLGLGLASIIGLVSFDVEFDKTVVSLIPSVHQAGASCQLPLNHRPLAVDHDPSPTLPIHPRIIIGI